MLFADDLGRPGLLPGNQLGGPGIMATTSTPISTFTYFRPGGVDHYKRPGGVDTYHRP